MVVTLNPKGLLAALLLISTPLAAQEVFEWLLPDGFPVPVVPADNPMSNAKVALGRRLFFDNRLSGNESFSCSSCHQTLHAFAEPRKTAVGATGEQHRRNTPSLTNVAYNLSFGWSQTTASLEAQALIPMFNTEPVELGLDGREQVLINRMKGDGYYPGAFAAAFPDDSTPIQLDNITKAIAAFERTLVSGNSAYDRWLFHDDKSAMSAGAVRGMRLFFSERSHCGECHSGFNLAGPGQFQGHTGATQVFVNNGIDVQSGDRGHYEESQDSEDDGAFRIPSLRNIALTAPYMHDGRLDTLDEVIHHYASGGAGNSNQSPLTKGFELSEGEKRDLVSFLHALTDQSFLNDARYRVDAFNRRPGLHGRQSDHSTGQRLPR